MIMAGGTGGHVFPALAVAEVLRSHGADVFWIGTQAGLEAAVAPDAGFPIDWLTVTGLRGKGLSYKFKAPFMLIKACVQAARILVARKPNVVVGMGGFASGPGGLMAWLLRIPLVIHEQNRVPGTTNRILSNLAGVVLEAFPGSFDTRVKALCVGNPLRVGIGKVARTDRNTGQGKLRVLVLGGSLGAQALNKVVPQAVAKLGDRLEIYHQTGQATFEVTRQAYQKFAIVAHVEAFIDDMAAVYQWADIAICRAGAMTVSELAATGVASILIPFPHAIDDHQFHNARYLESAGAPQIIRQDSLNAGRLESELGKLLANRGRVASMSKAALKLARPNSLRTIADICLREAH